MKAYAPFLLLISFSVGVHAQTVEIAYPPASSFIPDASFLNKLDNRLDQNIDAIESPQKGEVRKIYKLRKEQLIQQLNEGKYLKDSLLDNFLQKIYFDILGANPYLRQPEALLIDRDVSPNAYCTGEGILAMNIGLLDRLENMDQIAFVLAHEIAHWHFDHVNQTVQTIVQDFSKKELRSSGQLDELSEGNVQAIRSLIYTTFIHTKEAEEQADSLAFELLANTRYDQNQYRETLENLDSLKQPKFTELPALSEWLFYNGYPFKGKWSMPPQRSGLYNEDAPMFLFQRDSLQTHPNIKDRIAALDNLAYRSESSNNESNEFTEDSEVNFKAQVEQEVLYSAFYLKKYPICLYKIAALKRKHPSWRWLDPILAELFYELYEARKSHTFGKQVPPLLDQDHWLFEIVTFLNNVRMSEFLKLTYWQFLERTEKDQLNEKQLFLYWKVASLLEKPIEGTLKEAYLQKYPQGLYVEEITKS